MDSDTMTSPKQFQRVLREFGQGEIDILLGTQMVAKGLDFPNFPNVSLVGIASADTALAINDFRSSERTFQLIVQVAGRAGRGAAPGQVIQLIVQVAGRAGRGAAPGQVIVQTLHGDDPAIQAAEHHDHDITTMKLSPLASWQSGQRHTFRHLPGWCGSSCDTRRWKSPARPRRNWARPYDG